MPARRLLLQTSSTSSRLPIQEHMRNIVPFLFLGVKRGQWISLKNDLEIMSLVNSGDLRAGTRTGRETQSLSVTHPRAFGAPSHSGFVSGRSISSYVGIWVLFHHDSSAAPQTTQTASPVCGTKNFSSVRLYSAPQLH